MTPGVVFMASDHAGLALKDYLAARFAEKGWKVEDLGAHSKESRDYPEFADKLCRRVLDTGHKGVLICGSGIGMSMAANRYPGIRAALCTHEWHARMSREHNDANVICLGERITAPHFAAEITELFLNTAFAGGRHQQRVELMDKLHAAERA